MLFSCVFFEKSALDSISILTQTIFKLSLANVTHRTCIRTSVFDAKMSSMNASNDPGEAIKVYVRVRQLLGREEVNKIEWKVDDERSISSKNGAKK